MIRPEHAPHYLGHNPLQQLSYTGIYAVAALQVVTGFALYGQSNPGGFFFRAFNWIGTAAGRNAGTSGSSTTSSTWVFLIFIPIHVYLAMRADVLERSGSISSIITGGRFVPSGRKFVDE